MLELRETNHGIDGHDAKTKTVALFTTEPLALAYLKARGFTHKSGYAPSYYHQDPRHRNTMGAISYEIRPRVEEELPIDPK